MGGIFLLVVLCIVMATASFLAGALPLSMTLSQSQLRLLTSIGIGILVGTSLIVIIPEGIEAASSAADAGHVHRVRALVKRGPLSYDGDIAAVISTINIEATTRTPRDEATVALPLPQESRQEDSPADGDHHDHEEEEDAEVPTFEIGFSMIVGFIFMFLIDRLPRHAAESMQTAPQTRQFSLDNLGANASDTASIDEEAEGFLGSLTPTPRRARSLATTTGLVIHAAADGIAMGASATSSDMKLGFIIFLAIMIHKAPAAFGLTSLLLKQGLSKRAARGHLIVFSLAAPVGALATWLLVTILGGGNADGNASRWWTGMLLLFSGGTFLYVAMHAMQEGEAHSSPQDSTAANGYVENGSVAQRRQKGPQMRDTLATVVGMLLPLLTQFGHHH